MTDLSDDQITALCDAATPGPWDWWQDDSGRGEMFVPDGTMGAHVLMGFTYFDDCDECGRPGLADAELMAAARELVPALLARAQAAEAAVRRVRELADHWESLGVVTDVMESPVELAEIVRAAVEGAAP